MDEICSAVPEDESEKTCGQHLSDRILSNDFSVIEIGEYPWLIAILIKDDNKYNFKSWGSLIHPQAVLTTTHNLKT